MPKKKLKKQKKDVITKNMPIGKIISKYPETVDIFFKHGLHCVGCAVSYGESIEEGAKVHGIKVTPLLKDLNKLIKKEKGYGKI